VHPYSLPKINISACVIDHSLDIGEVKLADDQPRVMEATKTELLGRYEGWGHDALNIFGSVETSSKWSVEVVYPPLDTYVKGRVALVGDAVSSCSFLCQLSIDTSIRHML
jgi:salicylate hydroxylase